MKLEEKTAEELVDMVCGISIPLGDDVFTMVSDVKAEILRRLSIKNMPINIIFDGPPSHEAGRFVEVETDDGKSINVGEWIRQNDQFWALRITELPSPVSSLKLEGEK